MSSIYQLEINTVYTEASVSSFMKAAHTFHFAHCGLERLNAHLFNMLRVQLRIPLGRWGEVLPNPKGTMMRWEYFPEKQRIDVVQKEPSPLNRHVRPARTAPVSAEILLPSAWILLSRCLRGVSGRRKNHNTSRRNARSKTRVNPGVWLSPSGGRWRRGRGWRATLA